MRIYWAFLVPSAGVEPSGVSVELLDLWAFCGFTMPRNAVDCQLPAKS